MQSRIKRPGQRRWGSLSGLPTSFPPLGAAPSSGRHKQLLKKTAENTRYCQSRHAAVCHNGDGFDLLLPHLYRHLPQNLTGFHRGLHVCTQMDLRGDVVDAGLIHQDPAGPGEHRLHGVPLPQDHVDGGQGLGGIDIHQGVVGKAVVEQALGRLKALVRGIRLEHHRDELHAVPLGGGRQAVPGAVGGSRLEAGGPLKKAHQLVGIGQLELAVPDGVHPDGGILPDGAVGDEGLGPLIHLLHKGRLAARQMLSQGHSGVIARHHCHRLEHVIHTHLLPFL